MNSFILLFYILSLLLFALDEFHYFGKTNVTAARTPKFDLESLGETWIRGPMASETIWVPSLVTAEIVGFINAVVVDEIQFCVISAFNPSPAPLFQL